MIINRMLFLAFLPLFNICLDTSPFFIKAREADISGELKKYKIIFANEKGEERICQHLNLYMKYWQKTLLLLNKGLEEDKGLYQLIEKKGEFHDNKVSFPINDDPLICDLKRYIDKNGLRIGYKVGNIYLYFDPNYMGKNYKGILPDIIIDYFNIESLDKNEGFEEDAAITVSWECLRRKIIRYDEYLYRIKKLQCTYIISEIKNKLFLYLSSYLRGLPNSRIDDCINDVKRSYEAFLEENKKSIYYSTIKKYYQILKKNDFKFIYENRTLNNRLFDVIKIYDETNRLVPLSDVADRFINEIKLLIESIG